MDSPPSNRPVPPRPVLRSRLYEQVADQISTWIMENGLLPGDRLPPERELAQRLGVSRATLSQALVALEVIGAVVVRHGDGTVLTGRARTAPVMEAIRAHADRLPEIIEARDALESKLAALAAVRRTDADLAAIQAALEEMEREIDAGGRGVEADEQFHGAITTAARSELLTQMMAAIHDLIRETRLESLSQPGRPRESLAGHQRVADAIAVGDPDAAALAMHEHVMLASDVALLREQS
ncbi:GntR family transcriptional repressor for pyruvate dehydrogenase complex [Kribbella steppae]|uniref:GntR family transcriptional repressor for pyruvate dehydrogenase complex n=1 Tax=Kribbella steppae TaxID=2512223 RepID=A0A4R2HDQ1_9ACTN|nr:FadR/GntR family transcriptional regulator [Kribbella steppae]TCO26390.1 GntR family transcriptional repressor for pyruvate dehydrogenase complex [Kribbella steppae]